VSIRVQITRQPTVSSIDGVQVDGFELGGIYEVGTSIATVLLAEGWATPIPLDEAAPPDHFSEKDPNLQAPYRDPDAPPNLTREHYPPYLDRRSEAAAIERRHRPRKRK
jgi:hypothetical protein